MNEKPVVEQYKDRSIHQIIKDLGFAGANDQVFQICERLVLENPELVFQKDSYGKTPADYAFDENIVSEQLGFKLGLLFTETQNRILKERAKLLEQKKQFKTVYLPWLKSLGHHFNDNLLLPIERRFLSVGSEHRSETGQNIVHALIDKFEYFQNDSAFIKIITPFIAHKPELLEQPNNDGLTPSQYLFASKVPPNFDKKIFEHMKKYDPNCTDMPSVELKIKIEEGACVVVKKDVKVSGPSLA